MVRYTYGPETMIPLLQGTIFYHLAPSMTATHHGVSAEAPRPAWTLQSTCGIDERSERRFRRAKTS